MNQQPDIPLLLIFPFNQLAHYLRCLTLAKELRPYFTILFAHSDTYASFIRSEGFKTFPCLAIDNKEVLQSAQKFDFSWLNEENLLPVYTDQVRAIREYQPVAVLGDTSPTLKMAAEKTGVTYISLFNGYMSKYYAGVRNLSRTFPGYQYMKKLPQKLVDFMTQKGEAIAFLKVHEPFKKIRQKQGLPPKQNYLDELEGDWNLICDLPRIFPQKPLPSHYTFIPPLYYTSGTSGTGITEQLDKTKKTIFVSMGSTGDWEKVRFLNDPYFSKYNMVTAGDANHIVAAPSVIAVSFVSVSELFPLTDLVICHGGNGTVYQALSYGVPLLCRTAHFEQEWNVHRIEELGLGKSLDDIHHIEDYRALVEEWTQKKETEVYHYYRRAIEEAHLNFEKTIREVVSEILD